MVELREHQKRVLDQLRTGVILQGGVGSGKSITALAYYYIYELGAKINPLTEPIGKRPLYIITTAQKRDKLEWDGECARFALSTNTAVSIGGIKVVIDSWNNIGKYTDVTDAFFIFDEQRLIGSGSWVKSFLKITKNNNHWMVLTATPGDTWIDYAPIFIANGFYKNRTAFIVHHVVYSRFSKYPRISHYINTDELIKHRDDIVVQMTYKHATEIHKIELMAEYDKETTDIIIRQRWNVFTDKPIRYAGERCLAEREIANSDPSRLILLENVLKEHPKLIVFYNFNYELDLMKKFFLEKNNIRYAEWNGHRHDPVPTGDSWVYLVNYMAGSEGWNCIATNAIFFYSQNYSYRTQTQAEGRVNRLNTPFTDLYYYYVKSKAPIDVSIAKALANKRNFNEKEYDKQDSH